MIYIKEYPTHEKVKQLFDYRDGNLYWKQRPLSDFKTSQGHGAFNATLVGKKACGQIIDKYEKIKLNKKYYLTHRLIYIWHFNDLTETHEVDHIDNNPSNNDISNLRLANRKENISNTVLSSKNKSGIKGVSFDSSRGKWMAQIKHGDTKISKRFNDIKDAESFIKALRVSLHGDFHNHGV